MRYRREEYTLMAQFFIMPQNVVVVAMNIMLLLSNQLLFNSQQGFNFRYYAYLAYQCINMTFALLAFALIVKVHRSNFNLIDMIVGTYASIVNRSKPAMLCYSYVAILRPYTISLFKGQTPFGTLGSILMYIFFICCLLFSSLFPLTSLNPLSPFWSVLNQPIVYMTMTVPAIQTLVKGFPHPLNRQDLRIARAQSGTYLVRHENGTFVSYTPHYGNARGKLQDDIMYWERLQRQEEERRMAMEYERRAQIFDDMERRGVQFATYSYFT